jgi:hypothetical protein
VPVLITMNCRNCGAPMQLFERRRYYFCTFCGTFAFIDTPEVEGVRVIERPVPALRCPVCSAPLAKALLDDAYLVEHCEQCRGILLRRGRSPRRSPAGVPANRENQLRQSRWTLMS